MHFFFQLFTIFFFNLQGLDPLCAVDAGAAISTCHLCPITGGTNVGNPGLFSVTIALDLFLGRRRFNDILSVVNLLALCKEFFLFNKQLFRKIVILIYANFFFDVFLTILCINAILDFFGVLFIFLLTFLLNLHFFCYFMVLQLRSDQLPLHSALFSVSCRQNLTSSVDRIIFTFSIYFMLGLFPRFFFSLDFFFTAFYPFYHLRVFTPSQPGQHISSLGFLDVFPSPGFPFHSFLIL